MRFQRLEIPAFGPFTNLELKFPTKDHDLHLIYGANEAGKSSLLRAMRDLLFGIHGQSPDNFVHQHNKLRLLGEVVNNAGDQLIFQRRKGRSKTLLDAKGEPISDDALLPYLGSIDKDYFSAMFGLGQKELHEGAEQLLRGEGAIGKALFSASLGGTPVQRVLDSLIEESERLFKGRSSSNVSIRPAVKRYKDFLKKSRDAMVNPHAWDKLEKELADQEEMKRILDEAIIELDSQLGWITRCEDALPSVGRLVEEMALLEGLPALPDLASDFVERATSSRDEAKNANATVEQLKARFEQQESEQEDCQTSPEFMAEAEALDQFNQGLEAYLERKDKLAKLQSKLVGIESGLRTGMKGLEIEGGFESLEKLELSSAVRLGCDAAAKALSEAMSNHETGTNKAAELKLEIDSLEADLKSMPKTDLTSLREALAVAAEATHANKTLPVSKAEVENLTRQIATEHTLVIGAPKDLDTTAALSVPSSSTIRTFREKFSQINHDIESEKNRISDEKKRVKALQTELARLERRGELPSEDVLQDARSHRDQGWEMVLAEWKGEGTKEELDSGVPLEEAFPKTISKADDIADQLRQDAEAVAQAEEKRTQITSSEDKLAEAQEKLTGFHHQLADCQEAWEAEWAETKVKVRSPEEMDEWRDAWVGVRDSFSKLTEAKTEVETKTQLVRQARATLAKVLDDSEEKEFVILFEAARFRVESGEEATGGRNVMVTQLDEKKRQLVASNHKKDGLIETVDTATENWKKQCETVGLPDGTSPVIGLKLLQDRKELLTNYHSWKERSSEADMTKKAVLQYEAEVSAKAKALKVSGDTTESQVATLKSGLAQAREAQAQSDQLARQIKKSKSDLTEAQLKESQANQTMEELMRLVKLKTLEELEPLLANLERRDTIQKSINDFRETLGGLARGQSLDEFVTRVRSEAVEELPIRKGGINNEQEEKARDLHAIKESLMTLNAQKKEMEKAGDAAADFRQQAESEAATIKEDASRFVRLRLAANSLQDQIERFRKENQGPLLDKSGQVFRQITKGAFDGLGAKFNDQDVPVMVGQRPDGAHIGVEGMSDGSRDQLYLALRLAALDHYLEDHEAMPLILDDLLITFDDERAKAILPLLADLGKRTQIFLFTHHEHLVELCRQTLGEDQFHLHRI